MWPGCDMVSGLRTARLLPIMHWLWYQTSHWLWYNLHSESLEIPASSNVHTTAFSFSIDVTQRNSHSLIPLGRLNFWTEGSLTRPIMFIWSKSPHSILRLKNQFVLPLRVTDTYSGSISKRNVMNLDITDYLSPWWWTRSWGSISFMLHEPDYLNPLFEPLSQIP